MNSTESFFRAVKYAFAFGLILVFIKVIFALVTPAQAGAYQVGTKLIGLHERKQPNTLRKALGVNPRRVPWCGAYV